MKYCTARTDRLHTTVRVNVTTSVEREQPDTKKDKVHVHVHVHKLQNTPSQPLLVEHLWSSCGHLWGEGLERDTRENFGGVGNYCFWSHASYLGLFVKIHQAMSLWSAYFSALLASRVNFKNKMSSTVPANRELSNVGLLLLSLFFACLRVSGCSWPVPLLQALAFQRHPRAWGPGVAGRGCAESET